jgi:hypothetical protein
MPTRSLPLPHNARKVVRGINKESVDASELVRKALAFNRINNREKVTEMLLAIARPVEHIMRSSDYLLADDPNAALDILEPPKLTDTA